MSKAAFIAGDWGTSRLRLFLCDARGHTLDYCPMFKAFYCKDPDICPMLEHRGLVPPK